VVRKLSELLNAERFATEIALTKAGRPNCNLIFSEIDELTLGEAIMMYEIQTVCLPVNCSISIPSINLAWKPGK
jgi:glucose-6-phosphate isomerase